MNRSRKMTVNKYVLVYSVVILSFVPASYLHRIAPMVVSIETLVKALTFAYVLISLIQSKGKVFKNKIILLILSFWIYLLGSTLLYSGNPTEYFRTLWNVISFVLFAGIALDKKPNEFIKSGCVVFGTYILINTIATIVSPNGLYDTVSISGVARTEASYFLGHKNNVLNYMLPGILCICYKNYSDNKRIKLSTWIYVAGICCCCIIGQSLTSTIAFAVVIISIVFSDKGEFSRYVNTYTALLINLIFFVFIVVFRVQEKFSYFLISLTGKGLDMNGRTFIWDKGLLAILQHPFIGHGIEPINDVLNNFMINNDSFHNLIVDYLYEGGIIGFLLFIAVFFVLAKRIERCNNLRIKNLCNAVMVAISINWLSQPTTRTRALLIYIPVLLISYMCDDSEQTLKL